MGHVRRRYESPPRERRVAYAAFKGGCSLEMEDNCGVAIFGRDYFLQTFFVATEAAHVPLLPDLLDVHL